VQVLVSMREGGGGRDVLCRLCLTVYQEKEEIQLRFLAFTLNPKQQAIKNPLLLKLTEVPLLL